MSWATPIRLTTRKQSLILYARAAPAFDVLPVLTTPVLDLCRSQLSARYASEARQAVLSFFRAPPGYTVIFTANATGALKLVGEAFPFTEGSSFVLGADSHNSVHGIRQFALQRKAEVHYIQSCPQGGVDDQEAMVTVTC